MKARCLTLRRLGCVALVAGLIASVMPRSLQAEAVTGLRFEHEDWMLVCDNTRTCRAVGYQRFFEDSESVAVLLTRKAGPEQPLTGEVKIGELDLEEAAYVALTSDADLSLVIDGQEIGKVKVDPAFLGAELPDEVLLPLLRALRRDSVIEWVHDQYRWRLSDAGASAVFLKMDDVQGRIGTPGALVRKGNRPEAEVLPALVPPVVIAAPVDASPVALPAADEPALRATLRTLVDEETECSGLAMPEDGGEALDVVRLSDSRLMVAVSCWMAAYNGGSGIWVINDSKPYQPVLVTGSATEFDGGTVSAMHKGRGIGDCYAHEEWTWDGEQFVHTLSSTTGQCRGLAAGGVWDLPERVTELRQAAARPLP
ncbi:DUF1176 domain-containing protein [Alcanivorax sp.]|uniref:DUF1176 domain-containing protein n=2 Tax=Alcanivorax TaxID=59753 RepID=UPI0025C0A20E|nr:DUF1176 domain-containing protein [Alcanivorax sp.]